MPEQNAEKENFSLVHKALHWVSAALIFLLLAMGMYMGLMAAGGIKYDVYALHKSFGLLVLALTFVRVLVIVIKGRPGDIPEHKKWERALAHIVQGVLYVALIAMPVSGWVMSSAGGFGAAFFGVRVPNIVPKSEVLSGMGHEVHETLAWILMVALALHIAGALKHYFIDKDKTLQRMSWRNIKLVYVVLLCALIAGAYGFIGLTSWRKEALEEAEAMREKAHNEMVVPEEKASVIGAGQDERTVDAGTMVIEASDQKLVLGKELPLVVPVTYKPYQWIIDKSASTLSFEATQYGQKFQGSFDFDGEIIFNPKNLDEGSVKIEIDISSIATGSLTRDEQARTGDWFDAEHFPVATFRAAAFTKGEEEGAYIAHGVLSLHGVDLPIDLPFTLSFPEEKNSEGLIGPVQEVEASGEVVPMLEELPNNDKKETANNKVEMMAQISLSRSEFGIGQGEWKDDDVISDNVVIFILLHAQKPEIVQ